MKELDTLYAQKVWCQGAEEQRKM